MIRFFLLSLLLALAFSFSPNDYQKKPKTLYNVRQLVTSYSEARIVKKLRDFVSCCRSSRLPGTKEQAQAYKKIKASLEAHTGPDVKIQTQNFKPDLEYVAKMYDQQIDKAKQEGDDLEEEALQKMRTFYEEQKKFLNSLKSNEGKNIIWEKKGLKNPEKVIVFLAHYDSVAFQEKDGTKTMHLGAQLPGADKNASGVSVLLSMAEFFNQVETPMSVRLVFLDYGEFFSLGARSYLDQLEKLNDVQNVSAFIDVMMVGHSSKSSHEDGLEHDMRFYYVAEKDKNFAEKLRVYGDKMGTPLTLESQSWKRDIGGHLVFSKTDRPSFLMSQNWEKDLNKRTQTSNDFVETLNFKTLHSSFRYLSGAALAFMYQF